MMTTFQENNLTGRQPYMKLTLQEDSLRGRRPHKNLLFCIYLCFQQHQELHGVVGKTISKYFMVVFLIRLCRKSQKLIIEEACSETSTMIHMVGWVGLLYEKHVCQLRCLFNNILAKKNRVQSIQNSFIVIVDLRGIKVTNCLFLGKEKHEII